MEEKLPIKKAFDQNKHTKIKKELGHPEKANIAISFREEVGRTMNAAFFDHYTGIKSTNYPTIGVISPCNPLDQDADRRKNFTAFINNEQNAHSLALKEDIDKKPIPEVITQLIQNHGLLMVPGARRFPKPGEHHEERQKYELELLKNALLIGRPILAICGASRKLWTHFGGEVTNVEGHTAANMPTIEANGDLGNNQQLHRIALQKDTLLKACMTIPGGEIYPTVNSIHWDAAVANNEVLKILQVSALSKELNPDEKSNLSVNTIEAYENKYGAPLFGIQWHPEAYFKNSYINPQEKIECQRQQNIISYLAKAGDAFQAKQLMLKDFKKLASPSAECLKLGLFRNIPPFSRSPDETFGRKPGF